MSENSVLDQTFLPELGLPQKGKNWDIYDQDHTLALISTDYISSDQSPFSTSIADKGRIFADLSHYWFRKTEDIIPNHILSQPDPNVLIVQKCLPIKIELIVRSHLVGPLFRDYERGERVKCGTSLPDGLKENDLLPEPILTPITKGPDGKAEETSQEKILTLGIISKEQWNHMEEAAFALFKRGQGVAKEKGLILIDAKYEFGITKEGVLTLINEIHTPSSSHYWIEGKEDGEGLEQLSHSAKASEIPEKLQEEIREGYKQIYEMLMDKPLPETSGSVKKRVLESLKKQKMLKGQFALILAGSEKDQPHIDKITHTLTNLGIPNKTIIASAHKTPQKLLDLIELYNESIEPLVCITVAGRSNALSGVVAANLKWPVLACPPFKDHADYLTNIHSSLQMPSLAPAMTIINPKNCALATERILKTMTL